MLALSLTGTKAIIAYIVVIVIVVIAAGMYYTRSRRH